MWIHWALFWNFRHQCPVCFPERVRTSCAQLRRLRRRRARDRNSGARTIRALQLTASSDINARSRRTGPRHRHIRPSNRHDIPETYIDFIAHSCAERNTIPGGKIVLALPTETEGNVRLGARVRPLLCLAKILAVFGRLNTLHLSPTVMYKVTIR